MSNSIVSKANPNGENFLIHRWMILLIAAFVPWLPKKSSLIVVLSVILAIAIVYPNIIYAGSVKATAGSTSSYNGLTITSYRDDLTSTPVLAVDLFDAYIKANLCQSPSDKDCLEVLEFKACRSGCWRKGYNKRMDPETTSRLDIHMSMQYLRKLRTLVSIELREGGALPGQHTFGLTLKDLLYSQVQMMLRHPNMAFRSSVNGWALALGDVISGRTVDPAKFSGVVWTNAEGTAHAMTQADVMRWLVSVAEMFASRGHGATGKYYLQLAERFFESFSIPHRLGGVRNDKTRFRCHDNKYCYWFHSQEVHDYPMASSILNKDVYAIRDLVFTAHAIKQWQQFGTCNCPDGSCFRKFNGQSMVDGASFPCNSPGDDYPIGAVASNLADQMLERARGGLFNLAYGPGNNSEGRFYRIPPPNLKDFMAETSIQLDDQGWQTPYDPYGFNSARTFFRSYYSYWIDDAPAPYEFERGPADIVPQNNCHYHYLTLRLFYDVLQRTENSIYLASNSDFTDARYSLLYGRNPERPNRHMACPVPRKGVSESMADVPLAEFYLSGRTPGLEFQVDDSKMPDEWKYKDHRCSIATSDFIEELKPYRAWYDEKYENCSF